MSDARARLRTLRGYCYAEVGSHAMIDTVDYAWLLDVADGARHAAIAIGQDYDVMESMGDEALDALHKLTKALGLTDAGLDTPPSSPSPTEPRPDD
jgi:hypothetical protein